MSNQLFLLSLANIYSLYPKVFQELISHEKLNRNSNIQTKVHIRLPSDRQWQEQVYRRLLECQRRVNEALETEMAMEESTRTIEKPVFDSSFVIDKFSPVSSSARLADNTKDPSPDRTQYFRYVDDPGIWTLLAISKAAKLIRKPPLRVHFQDECEMRRVYSVIYDVYRYKVVMKAALMEISFFAHYPELLAHEDRVWLMLLELHMRKFLKRVPEDHNLQIQLYKEADVEEIAEALWTHRVRLAASISRMRIRCGALNIVQLLPFHLQNEKVAIAAAKPTVTGWINPFLLPSKGVAQEYLKTFGLTQKSQNKKEITNGFEKNQYKWDKICPLFLTLHPDDRSEFAKSDLIQKHYFIMQDRTFAFAPAVISQLLDYYELEGDVLQTHVSSPRSTAYLASLLHSVRRVKKFLVYGCGEMLSEYKDYMKTLGIQNIHLHSECFVSVPVDSELLVSVVGILATPPNSCSAVTDPIDLICSRGGDLKMLQLMTEAEISNKAQKRVADILEMQRETLRLCMARPHVQFVVYQTNSVVNCENLDMAQIAVNDINQCAFEKHLKAYLDLKKQEAILEAEAAGFAISPPRKRQYENDELKDNQDFLLRYGAQLCGGEGDSPTQLIKVPKTDQFEIVKIPEACLTKEGCFDPANTGCYIALIQRKEITRLNAKRLIKMAEERGMFGKGDREKSAKSRSSKKSEKPEMKKPNEQKASKPKKSSQDVLIKRINQPTHASVIRSGSGKFSLLKNQSLSFNSVERQCGRYFKRNYLFSIASSRATRWWQDTCHYIQYLQKRLKNRKGKCDDIYDVRKLMKSAPFPLYLPCRDRRILNLKQPYPVAMNYLNFNPYVDSFENSRIPGFHIDLDYWRSYVDIH